jgi:hypothetical protein
VLPFGSAAVYRETRPVAAPVGGVQCSMAAAAASLNRQ